MRTRRVLTIILIPVLLLLAIGAYILATVNTDRTITIGAGIPGSASFEIAEHMQQGLALSGFDVEIESTAQTLDLITSLAAPDHAVDVTFVSEGVRADDFPDVQSLGTIGLQPMVFGTMPGAGDITSLAQARGRHIDIGPVGSVRADFASQVLAQFGVTPVNSTFVHLAADASRAELEQAGVEVVSARWSDPRSYLRTMVGTGEIKIIPLPEAQALAGKVHSAEPVTIPYAGLQINPPIPTKPFPTIAQLISVVATDELSPAAAYAIARELTEQFSAGDAISTPGEFPNFSDRQLPINQYAADFYNSGSIPWQFDHLPPLIADSFVSLIVVGTFILLIASVYSLFLPEAYSLWTGVIKPRTEERYIASMEAALAEGRELTLRQRTRLSEILEQQDAGRVLRQRAETLRPNLSTPVDNETDNEHDPRTGEVLGDRVDD